jgi:hypothetical protein
LRHIHQTLPQARTVDSQRGKVSHDTTSPHFSPDGQNLA